MKRWARFGLWQLLIVVLVVALPLSWVAWLRSRLADERAAVHEAQLLHASTYRAPPDAATWMQRLESKLAGGTLRARTSLRFERLEPESIAWGPYGPGGTGVALKQWTPTNIATLKGILRRIPGLDSLTFTKSVVPEGLVATILPACDLNYLSLSGTDAGPDDFAALSRVPMLELLDLTNTRFADNDVEHVCKLVHLKLLHLHGTQVTDVGIHKLRHLSNLENVNLGLTRVTEEVIPQLIDWQVKTKLIVPAEWSSAAVKRLMDHSPAGCEVRKTGSEFRFLSCGPRSPAKVVF